MFISAPSKICSVVRVRVRPLKICSRNLATKNRRRNMAATDERQQVPSNQSEPEDDWMNVDKDDNSTIVSKEIVLISLFWCRTFALKSRVKFSRKIACQHVGNIFRYVLARLMSLYSTMQLNISWRVDWYCCISREKAWLWFFAMLKLLTDFSHCFLSLSVSVPLHRELRISLKSFHYSHLILFIRYWI